MNQSTGGHHGGAGSGPRPGSADGAPADDGLGPTVGPTESTPPLGDGADGAKNGPPPAPPDFELVVLLGRGGFGEVWLARHRVLGVHRAVKLIPPRGRDELLGLRMLFERIPAHPRLCPIETVGEVGDWLYCVMPLADSAAPGALDPARYQPMTLAEHLSRVGRLGEAEAAALGADLAEGLAHLHTHGAVHGDVKPANILRIDGQWRLADYGLLSGLEHRDARGATQGYAPPEGPGTPAGDQHALGVTLHRALTGRGAASFAREREARGATSSNGADSALEAVIWKAGAADPERRYASMAELRDDLRAASGGGVGSLLARAWSRARVALAAAAVAAVAALGVVRVAGDPLIEATGLHAAYSSWLRAWSPELSEAALDRVVVVAMDDATDFGALAAEAGLDGVDNDHLVSLRLLHGEMATRLAGSGARVVVWDLHFPRESPFDHALVGGISALSRAGVGVVVGLKLWDIAPEATNPIVQRLLDAGAAFGGIEIPYGGDGAGREYWPAIAVDREGAVIPSLSLSAMAAWMDPRASYDFRLDPSKSQLSIDYFALRSASPRLAKKGVSGVIRPGAIVQGEASQARSDFNRLSSDRCIVNPLPALPSQETLDRITRSYAEVFQASPDERRRMLVDRLVIVGDFRERSGDWITLEGRRLYGPYVQALATLQLMESQTPRMLTIPEMQLAAALCALTGALLGVASRARSRRWLGATALVVSAAVLAAAIVLGSALMYRTTGLLVAAIPLAATLLVGAALGYLLLPVAERLGRRWSGARERAVYG